MASPLTARSQSDPGSFVQKLSPLPSFPSCALLKIYLHLNSVPRREDFCAFGEKTGARQTPRSGAVVPDRNYHRCPARFAHGRTGRPHNLHNLHTLHNCTSAAHLGSPGLTAKCGECAVLVTSRGPLKVPPRPLPPLYSC